MEELLQMASGVSDKAEVYSREYTSNTVQFENAKLQDIRSTFQSGVSLRIIRDSKLGFAYTKNLVDRGELLQNALHSLEGGVEADYDFPFTKEIPELDTYDPSIETLSTSQMVEECARVCEELTSGTDGELTTTSFAHSEHTRVVNSKGTDISGKRSFYGIYGRIIYPGSATGILRFFYDKKFEKTPGSMIDEMIKLYRVSSNVVEPKGGRMKAMFMPFGMTALMWRIANGVSSKSVYEKNSPIADKIGETIFHDKLTICDDPLNDKYPGARAFDDEGVACKPLTIVEKGVLNSFYYDLTYASKLKAKPTGHGYRTTRWGEDTVALRPAPALSHLTIQPGSKSFSQLVESIDRGIIIEGALGAHSGNIPNGDYSIGVSPGLYVENGEIVGRVKDAMVAGNIYQTLKHVVDVGDTLHYSWAGGWVPAILFDGVSVATKN